MAFNARLDAVSKAKKAYVLAKATLEARLREQLASELANLQTQVDIAIRYAIDSGESKANVLRALGTTAYSTIYESLERTSGVAEIVGANPLDDVFTYEVTSDGVELLHVHYVNHGGSNYSGQASFKIKRLDDGTVLFLSEDSLWNEDFTVRNDAVVALDGRKDGEYYDEAAAWLRGKNA